MYQYDVGIIDVGMGAVKEMPQVEKAHTINHRGAHYSIKH